MTGPTNSKGIKDYTGHRFGRLTALTYSREHYPRKGSQTFWTCQCACGNISKYIAGNLTTGRTTTCKKCSPKYARKAHYYDRQIKLTYQGKTQSLREWAAELEIPVGRILSRRQRKLPIELVLFTKKIQRYITHDGRTQSIPEWAAELGITIQAMHARLKYYGWTEEQATAQPKRAYS